jgi:NAD(P)-dependent dehydrogenase (short-subunit alcohol dehydrogenase family)
LRAAVRLARLHRDQARRTEARDLIAQVYGWLTEGFDAQDPSENINGRTGEEDMNAFDSMCAVVTGSASGLGAATAVALARGGARVIINYRTRQREAEETADLCRAANAVVKVMQADVAIDEDCRRLAAAASEWGRLDILVNNASTTKHVANPADLDELSAEDFHRIYSVNTIGPFQMIRAARALLEAGARAAERASSVVNVSSVAAFSGSGSSIAYVASKAALNTLTLGLARVLAPLIRVNAICPGYMYTPWWVNGVGQEAADRFRDVVRHGVPLRVASTAENIAEVVMFLAGSASRHMTGSLEPVDAGFQLLVSITPSGARR